MAGTSVRAGCPGGRDGPTVRKAARPSGPGPAIDKQAPRLLVATHANPVVSPSGVGAGTARTAILKDFPLTRRTK